MSDSELSFGIMQDKIDCLEHKLGKYILPNHDKKA